MRRLMMSARLAAILSLLLLALAGCGGDDDSDEDRPRAGSDAATQTDTVDRPETQTEAAAKPEERKKSDSGKDRDSRERKAARPQRESSRRDEQAGGDAPKASTPGAVAKRPRPNIKPSASAVRCLRRASRERGDDRLTAQARCLKMSAGRLRSLIRQQCRKAAKSEAAYRTCIRVTSGS